MTVTPEKEVKTNICVDPKKESPSPARASDNKKDSVVHKLTTETTMKGDALKKVAQLKKECPGFIAQAAANISRGSATKQLVVGSLAGWTTGFLTMKVGRTAAFAVGGSILLFQIAQHKGYVKMDWDKVKEKVDQTNKQFNAKYKYVEKSPQWRANITRFARTNTYFAAGFVGGFLIGMAS